VGDALELLEEIVTLWVTVRGFAITATWMEIYKAATKTPPIKILVSARGLRSLDCSDCVRQMQEIGF
jgi:hypothetical protein